MTGLIRYTYTQWLHQYWANDEWEYAWERKWEREREMEWEWDGVG